MLDPEITEVKATCNVDGGIADITLAFTPETRRRRQAQYVVDLPNGRKAKGTVDAVAEGGSLRVALADALAASNPPHSAPA